MAPGKLVRLLVVGKTRSLVGTVSGAQPGANIKKKKKIVETNKEAKSTPNQKPSFCYKPDAFWESPQTILLNPSYFCLSVIFFPECIFVVLGTHHRRQTNCFCLAVKCP